MDFKTLFNFFTRSESAAQGLGLALLLALLCCAPGCDKKDARSEQEAAPAPPFSLESFPRSDKMRLALLPCRVLPRTSVPILSPLAGQLRLYVDKPQTNLPGNFLWAEFEPKILIAESNALAEARARLQEKQHLTLELDLPKQTLKMAKDIEELRRQLALLEVFSTNKSLFTNGVNYPGMKVGSLNPENVERARQELRVMETNYAYLQQTNLAVLGVDLQSARTELERRSLDYERLQSQSRFKMPFQGQLNLNLQLVDGVKDYPVIAGQELAVIRDLSTILLRLAMADPSWSALSSEKMSAMINLPDGTRLEAPFAFKRIEKVQNREEVVYYFQFPSEKIPSAVRLLGTDVSCELMLSLERPARIVPKLSLVMAEPALFQNRRWNDGLTRLARGAYVLVEGQTDLAIVTPTSGEKKL
jgi:hypothetical protein